MKLKLSPSILLFTVMACLNSVEGNEREQLKFFESKVRPLLVSNCLQCHGSEKQKGKLRLDSLKAMLKGGKSGPAIVPHQPQASLLIKAINYQSLEMPPKGPLSPASIETLTRWIKMGAPWPKTNPELVRSSNKTFTEKERNWWAIKPVENPEPPRVESLWADNPIDKFIAHRLKQAKLEPARPADRYELVRRAYFDLHGLPPTPEQVERFVKDKRPNAWSLLIRELLDSPRYGERWAQHWLDVVRYSESDGYREDAFRPSASKFRDYVISSFNQDKPYDQFVREHLAGDEIAPEDPNVFIGTAFLRHGVYEWNQRNARMHWDLIINELTRVTGEAFLGLGIGCAQCHDHKFDPILQKDYFGLQAFLSSVKWPLKKSLATPEEINQHRKQQRAWEEQTRSIREQMQELTKTEFESNQKFTVRQFPDDIQAIYYKPEIQKTTYEKQLSYLVERQAQRAARRFDFEKALKNKTEELKRYRELKAELKKFASLKPSPLPDAFVATDIGPEPAPTYIYTRTSKQAIQPSFLTLLGAKPPQINPTSTTTGRRTALANWITRADNPLSTRVIVNRIWQRHFGKGIVATPNDFGTLGEPPSHPKLLDWLTIKFLEGGWKIKPLHELIMNSQTYRQTARREPTAHESKIDPLNRLLWRFQPRRLDAEQVRDAMLSTSGELKNHPGGASVDGNSPYRSIYVKKLRNKPDELLKNFDAPLGFESAPDRISTTTPLQSLLLVNGDWSLKRSLAFAKYLLGKKREPEASDIQRAYQIAFGRPASEIEVHEALSFIRHQASEIKAPIVKNKFPNENGLRPIDQQFKSVSNFKLGQKALWIQPGSRFERLEVKKSAHLNDAFTIEAITTLDRIYSNASVNTLISRWNGNKNSNGWNLGITSAKSAYQPRNFILQLIGRTFQDEPEYEVVASGLRFPLGKPVYLAASISANTSKENPTSGKVTFYLKDLSDPKSKPQVSTRATSIVRDIQNPALKLLIGGRDASGHLWDGQLARLKVSEGALTKEQLLIGTQPAQSKSIIDWTFISKNGEKPVPGTAWLRRSTQGHSSGVPNKMLRAVASFCHALFNSNEFLYLH